MNDRKLDLIDRVYMMETLNTIIKYKQEDNKSCELNALWKHLAQDENNYLIKKEEIIWTK